MPSSDIKETEYTISEILEAQSELDDAMKRTNEIILEIHQMRRDDANKSEVKEKLEFLKNDLLKSQKIVKAIGRQLQEINKSQNKYQKSMREVIEKLKAYQTEVSVLSDVHSQVELLQKKDFAEFRRLMHPSPPLRDLFTAIAMLFKVPKCKKWHNVQSFIAASTTKDKILALRPEHLDRKTVVRVRKFLNKNQATVNRLAAYKANKKVGRLEPWIRAMVSLGEKIVIDKIAPMTQYKKLKKLRLRQKTIDLLSRSVDTAKAKEEEVVETFNTIFERQGEITINYKTLAEIFKEKGGEEEYKAAVRKKMSGEKRGSSFPTEDTVSKEHSSRAQTRDTGIVRQRSRSQFKELNLSMGVTCMSYYDRAVSTFLSKEKKKNTTDIRDLSLLSIHKMPSVCYASKLNERKEERNEVSDLGVHVGQFVTDEDKEHTFHLDPMTRHNRHLSGFYEPSKTKSDLSLDMDVLSQNTEDLPGLNELLIPKITHNSNLTKSIIFEENINSNESDLYDRNCLYNNRSTSRKLRGRHKLDNNHSGDKNVTRQLCYNTTSNSFISNSSSRRQEEQHEIDFFQSPNHDIHPFSANNQLSVSKHKETDFFGQHDNNRHISKNNFNNSKLRGVDLLEKQRSDRDRLNIHAGIYVQSYTEKNLSQSKLSRSRLSEVGFLEKTNDDTRVSYNLSPSRRAGVDFFQNSDDVNEKKYSSQSDHSPENLVLSPKLSISKFSKSHFNPKNSLGVTKRRGESTITICRNRHADQATNLSQVGRGDRPNKSDFDILTLDLDCSSQGDESLKLLITPKGTQEDEIILLSTPKGLTIDESDDYGEDVSFESCSNDAFEKEEINYAESLILEEEEEDEEEEKKDGNISPRVLEALTLKLQNSTNDKEDEKTEISKDEFRDIILRWNSHKRVSLNYETDVAQIWKSRGLGFKKLKKVMKTRPRSKSKHVGYHIQDENVAPWFETVQNMRKRRASLHQ